MAKKDIKIMGGVFILIAGFYVLAQDIQFSLVGGLILAGVGLYLILSSLN